MAYIPATTPGGNLFLAGGGTFPQLQAGLEAMAVNRDKIDNELRTDATNKADAAKTSIVPDPDVEGAYLIGE